MPDSESLIQPLNEAIEKAKRLGMLIIFTRDWHPENHSSFEKFGGQWPSHCVQNTRGAEFHGGLVIPESVEIVNAGMELGKPGYSAYEDSKMAELINQPDLGTVFVAGIALEYCVRAVCLDTVKLGKRVVAIEPLIRSISQDSGVVEKLWAELTDAGVVRAQDMSEC